MKTEEAVKHSRMKGVGRRKGFGKSDPGNKRELSIGLWPINPDDPSKSLQ